MDQKALRAQLRKYFGSLQAPSGKTTIRITFSDRPKDWKYTATSKNGKPFVKDGKYYTQDVFHYLCCSPQALITIPDENNPRGQIILGFHLYPPDTLPGYRAYYTISASKPQYGTMLTARKWISADHPLLLKHDMTDSSFQHQAPKHHSSIEHQSTVRRNLEYLVARCVARELSR